MIYAEVDDDRIVFPAYQGYGAGRNLDIVVEKYQGPVENDRGKDKGP